MRIFWRVLKIPTEYVINGMGIWVKVNKWRVTLYWVESLGSKILSSSRGNPANDPPDTGWRPYNYLTLYKRVIVSDSNQMLCRYWRNCACKCGVVLTTCCVSTVCMQMRHYVASSISLIASKTVYFFLRVRCLYERGLARKKCGENMKMERPQRGTKQHFPSFSQGGFYSFCTSRLFRAPARDDHSPAQRRNPLSVITQEPATLTEKVTVF